MALMCYVSPSINFTGQRCQVSAFFGNLSKRFLKLQRQCTFIISLQIRLIHTSSKSYSRSHSATTVRPCYPGLFLLSIEGFLQACSSQVYQPRVLTEYCTRLHHSILALLDCFLSAVFFLFSILVSFAILFLHVARKRALTASCRDVASGPQDTSMDN